MKRQKFRIVPPRLRLLFIRYLIDILSAEPEIKWKDLIDRLAAVETGEESADASRNMANAMLIVARKAGVIRTLKGRTLATAPVLLALDSDKSFQEAVIRCDAAYLQAIKQLSEPTIWNKQPSPCMMDWPMRRIWSGWKTGWLKIR
ncbi:MAG: hypothetical protein R3C44_10115 [Chloroflexota bacterium]